MFGWLIVNKFLVTPKFNIVPRWLEIAARRKGVSLKTVTNADILCALDSSYTPLEALSPRPDFVIFWDKDIHLASLLEKQGLRLFNSARAIELCDDKFTTFLELYGSGIALPKTISAPKTFEGIGYADLGFIDQVIEFLGFPIVVKEHFGAFGKQVFLAHDKAELLDLVKTAEMRPLMFQEFVKTSYGKDIRVEVVGDQVVATMFRHSTTSDFRANVTNGGEMLRYKPSREQEAMALSVTKQLGLDFAGVDILFGPGDEPILCEVNSNAHFKNIYDCTGIDTADYLFDYIIKEIYH
jgi:RimK family alpha-L-glutamate ligase